MRESTKKRLVQKALASLLCVSSLLASSLASAQEKLKVGTLAPESSPWGQVFRVWQTAVAKKSDGKLELEFFYNGSQGDEGAMVAKTKSGQLDGMAVTTVGLSKIYRPILAMQMPGLFKDWDKFDRALETLKPEFEKGLNEAGFNLLGWGHVGQVRTMSKGFAIHLPDDLKGKKPYMWRDDLINPVLFQVVGVAPVPLNVPEVLPALNTGTINMMSAPVLAAEQLQWASKLDNIVDEVVGMAVGALVFSQKKLDSLSPEMRTVLLDTGKVAAQALTTRIRNEDAAAFKRLKGKMTVVTLTDDERAAWAKVFTRVRAQLGQGTFPPDLVSRIEGLAK